MPFDYFPIAMDGSVRSYDQDGRLHVSISHISKANICPYRGSEIPDFERLKLNPDQVYQLLRAPEELMKAAPTFNNVQLLKSHVPVTADEPKKELTVGSTGTDAVFRSPYLDNSLVIWDAEAIAGIETEQIKELSAAYHYDADMTSGTFDGHNYDGVMRNIKGNHVALVEAGRAGSDVVVMDSALSKKESKMPAKPKKVALSPQKRVNVIRAIAKLAQDATLDDVHSVLNRLDGKPDPIPGATTAPMAEKPPHVETDPENTNAGTSMKGPSASQTEKPEGEEHGEDAAPGGHEACMMQLHQLLDGKVDPETMQAVEMVLQQHMAAPPAEPHHEPPEHEEGASDPDDAGGVGEDEHEETAEDLSEEDESPEGEERKAEKEKEAEDRRMGKDRVSKPAMDAAITRAIAVAVKTTTDKLNGIAEARDHVRPWVGELALGMDSAADVYKSALEMLGIDVKGVHPSAFKSILAICPKPGDGVPRRKPVAMDAKGEDDFYTRYPNAARMRVIG